jgi:hypothetical protein
MNAHAGQTQAGHRQAALVLHGMRVEDRAWAMRRLSPQSRTILQGLLDELNALGIASDPALVRAATAATVPSHAIKATPAVKATPALVFAVLRQEPDALIARVLKLQAWSWREDVLALLGAKRTAQVEACEVRTAVSLDAALRAMFNERLAAEQAHLAVSRYQRSDANAFSGWPLGAGRWQQALSKLRQHAPGFTAGRSRP